MRFITNYKELNGASNESLLDHISEKPMQKKEDILEYLKNGEDDGVRCSGIFDYVSGEPTFETIHLFTDGKYCWDSEEIYHFERYNLSLNDDFIEYALSR